MTALTHNIPNLIESYPEEELSLIKNTVCRGASDSELKLFLYTCRHTRLDPLLKQIYAIKRGSTMTFQTSIDGLRLIAERTGKYSPGKEVKYSYSEDKSLLSATAYVNKLTQDFTWHEVAATAFFEEYAQEYNGRLSKFWEKMPHVMLAKCAEAAALRKAFPFELAGLYSSEEMNNKMNIPPVEDPFLTAEIVGSSEEDEVEIEIPNEVDKELVEEYIDLLAKHYKQPLPIFKKRIQDNMEAFWTAFHSWKAKKIDSQNENSDEEIIE